MSDSSSSDSSDLRHRLKAFAQPVLDSLDGRLRDQVDSRVDKRVEESLTARLSVMERAIADLDREVKELQQRLDHES